MTGNYGDYWQQQPMPPFPPPGVPTGYPPPPRKSRWPWIIGAVAVVVVVAVAAAAAIIGWVVTRSTHHTASTVMVTYEVTGTGKAKVRYNDAHDSVSTLTGVDLPWHIEVVLPTTVMPYVSGDQASAGPQIACHISSADTTIDEKKSVIGFVYCAGDPKNY